MREKFWDLFVDMKFKDAYFFQYELMTMRINTGIHIFLVLFSIGGVVWTTLGEGILSFIPAQIIQACIPYFRFSERLVAFFYADS